MELCQKECSPFYTANFAVRPGKLFDGVDMNLTILVGVRNQNANCQSILSTCYNRWYTEFRAYLFDNLHNCPTISYENIGAIGKISKDLERDILTKMEELPPLSQYLGLQDTESIHVHSGGRYFRKCLLKPLSGEYRELKVPAGTNYNAVAVLSSNLYYWYWIVTSDTYHVTATGVKNFPVPKSALYDSQIQSHGKNLLESLWENSTRRTRNRADGSKQVEVNFDVGQSKQLIDKIDDLLASHYCLSDRELDFIKNYDIKYRLGFDTLNSEECDE